MDANEITFGVKDVIGICVMLLGALGFIYAIKRSSEKAEDKYALLDTDYKEFKNNVNERFMHGKNSKKANIEEIMSVIDKNKNEVDKKETQIYTRISELKQEQQDAHEKLWVKLDTVETMQRAMSTSLAELTGYLKAKREA
jgi:hypothetical protein